VAEQLADRFTVFAYDRRGRGESGPAATSYSVTREVEDLLAVIAAAGGRAHVLGFSSGGALALEAARQGAPIERLVVFEAPFILDDTQPANDPRLPERAQAYVDAGRRGEAVNEQGRPVPDGYYAQVAPETLGTAGGKSPEYMRNAQAAVAEAVPRGRLETLPGQTHMVKAKVLAPVVAAFLGG
jgi:pimeloyl-ACP methyl ester carboxylesterase